MDTKWRSYEEVAAYLLGQVAQDIGLSDIEGKQTVQGKVSGTSRTIDAKGVRQGKEGFVIVECRRYRTSKQNQEKIGGMAWRIIDSGAAGGILVSPMGLQRGAQKVADAVNIIAIELDANCTPQEFAMRFLNRIFVGIHSQLSSSDHYDADVLRKCAACGKRFAVKVNEQLCPNCGINA